MKAVLLQPSYIPWRGFFHQIFKADLFIHYDDAQFDKHGWRNRNLIRNKNGDQLLTIPVLSKGNLDDKLLIKDIQINQATRWAKKHWAAIEQTYSKTRYFCDFAPGLRDFFAHPPDLLADFTIPLTEHLAQLLGIGHTRYERSSTWNCPGIKTGKIVSLLEKAGASHYISGPSAKSYLEENEFTSRNIRLEYMDYHYEPYPASLPDNGLNLSILDLLFHHGPNSGNYIWGPSPVNAEKAA